MEKELFIALKNEVAEKLPQIKTFGLFNNQFERQLAEQNKQNAFRYPALFVQFNNYEFRELGKQRPDHKNVQEFNFTLSTHLGFQSLTDDIEVLQLKQDVHRVIYHFREGYFTKLVRTSQTQDYDHGNAQVYVTQYSCSGRDFLTQTGRTITANLIINTTATLSGMTN